MGRVIGKALTLVPPDIDNPNKAASAASLGPMVEYSARFEPA